MYVYIVKSLKYKKHKIVKQLKMFSVSVSLVNDSIVHRCSSLIYVCIIPYVWEGGNSSPTWLSTVLPQLILLLSYLLFSTIVLTIVWIIAASAVWGWRVVVPLLELICGLVFKLFCSSSCSSLSKLFSIFSFLRSSLE